MFQSPKSSNLKVKIAGIVTDDNNPGNKQQVYLDTRKRKQKKKNEIASDRSKKEPKEVVREFENKTKKVWSERASSDEWRDKNDVAR